MTGLLPVTGNVFAAPTDVPAIVPTLTDGDLAALKARFRDNRHEAGRLIIVPGQMTVTRRFAVPSKRALRVLTGMGPAEFARRTDRGSAMHAAYDRRRRARRRRGRS